MTSKLLCVNIINSDDICIESISFSNCGQYLAASYGNNIAIYEVRSSFLLTTLSDRNTDASFRSLLWIPFKNVENFKLSDYRLFTVGLHGIITEWDLNLFKSKESCTSYGGAIFSGVVSPNSDLLVTCDDGCVRSFTIWDHNNDKDRLACLEFKKVQVTHTKSILSICCLSDGRFFCGTSDSLILICDLEKDNYFNVIKVSSKKVTKRISKDSENSNEDDLTDRNKNVENENVHIWCLVYIPNNTLASGDSNGNVMLWDLETLTMLQLFTQHNSDVLSLVLLNNNTLFSAGLDSKVTMYTNNIASNPHYLNEAQLYLNNDLEDIENYLNNKSRVGWSVNGFKYPIKGDIRTLSVSSIQEYVASAGNFGCISICRGQRFLNHKKSKYKLIYPNIFPFNPVVSMNLDKNMSLVRYPYHCDLWYLPTSYDSNNTLTPDLDLSSNLDRKNQQYKQNDKFESEVPYKLCTMKMNVNKGEIKMCCLSPEGEFVVICNEQCIRILLIHLDDLKISQLKFEYPDLNVTSISFLSNHHLLLTHYKERNIVSVYNILDGSLKNLDYLDFNKHVIKVTTHPNKIHCEMNLLNNNCNKNHDNNDNEDNNNNFNLDNSKYDYKYNKDKNENGTDSEYDLINYGLGVFYCLDGTVYVVDFVNKSYLKLPNFEGGSRISSVVFNTDCKHLIAFSTSFKYYIFDINKNKIIKYQDQFVHNINTKVVNHNSVICNSFWISNTVIVHTSYNIFYFKLLGYPFNSYEEGTFNTPNINEKYKYIFKSSSNSNLDLNCNSNCNINDTDQLKPNLNNIYSKTHNEDVDISLTTPKQTKQHMNNFDDIFLTQSHESKKFNSPKNRKHLTLIAPRRLYQVPSIEHYVYESNDNTINNDYKYDYKDNISSNNNNKFIMNNNFSNGSRENSLEDTNKSLTTVIDCNLSSSDSTLNLSSSSLSLSSSSSSSNFDSVSGSFSLSTDSKESSEETSGTIKEVEEKVQETFEDRFKDKIQDRNQETIERNENQSPTKVIKSNEKLSIKYNNIDKSKFIIHADLLLRDQQINIMAFKTSLKDEVMRQKRYGN